MSDSKISNLTNYTPPLDADVVPIVDTANTTTKKVTWANIKATLKTYFDTLYPSGSGTSTGTNTGDQTLPVKATGSELDTGTDDAKFATAKAIKDAHNVPSVAPGTSGNVLTSNGTDWTSTTPSSSSTPKMILSTTFETAARFTVSKSSASAGDFNTSGGNLSLDPGAGEFVSIKWNITGTAGDLYKGSPTFTACIVGSNMVAASNSGSSFFGLGNPTVSGTGHTYTDRHIGFKLLKASGTVSLYATQADGTTETASSAFTTIVDGDLLDLICVVNGTASVDYYWRKNGGSLSAATNLTTNIPSGTSIQAQCSSSNNSSASAFTFILKGMSFQR